MSPTDYMRITAFLSPVISGRIEATSVISRRRMCSAEAADGSQKTGERLTMTHGKTEEEKSPVRQTERGGGDS